jgi:hypothetical protein
MTTAHAYLTRFYNVIKLRPDPRVLRGMLIAPDEVSARDAIEWPDGVREEFERAIVGDERGPIPR